MRECSYCGQPMAQGTYVELFSDNLLRVVYYLCADCVFTADSALKLGKEATAEWQKGNHRMYVLIEEQLEGQQLAEPLSLKEWTPQGLREPV